MESPSRPLKMKAAVSLGWLRKGAELTDLPRASDLQDSLNMLIPSWNVDNPHSGSIFT